MSPRGHPTNELAARRRRRAAWIAAAVVLAAAGLGLVRPMVAAGLRAAAARRHLDARWSALRVTPPARVTLEGLVLTDARSDTVARVARVSVALDPWALLLLHARPARVEASRGRIVVRRPAPASADTLAPPERATRTRRVERPAAARIRDAAGTVVRALLAPARRMPALALADLRIVLTGDEQAIARGVVLDTLALSRGRGGVRLAGRGTLVLERGVRFSLSGRWAPDDRLEAVARLDLPEPRGRASFPMRLVLDGALDQDRRSGTVTVPDSTRLVVDGLVMRAGGRVSRRGPALHLALAADGLTGRALQSALPPPVLGPLREVAVRGSFDYRLGLDLDLSHPDSVEFTADVVPHRLSLDSARTRLPLASLDQPFVAEIHLPHDRLVERDLSDANPEYRPLDRIDSLLVHAVVTNEDGAFFRHHGFNPEAVRDAIAEDLRSGTYRRGAGTITMQLARNLYLGHARTLSRKFQEVVLAWVIENLTRISKRRLLEIYLNIIEWGPGVHGAAEAARYYFDRDPGSLTPEQALFLTTVIPAPTRWRRRFEADGTLAPFERAQMHFIGRAMIAKGWLAPDELPPADSLEVTLEGPAREVLFPPAPPDSAAADTAGAADESAGTAQSVFALHRYQLAIVR